MKKLSALVLALIMVLSFAACGGEKTKHGQCYGCHKDSELYTVTDRNGENFDLCENCRKIFYLEVKPSDEKCEECGKEGATHAVKLFEESHVFCPACESKWMKENNISIYN